jgi:hypothetical protein
MEILTSAPCSIKYFLKITIELLSSFQLLWLIRSVVSDVPADLIIHVNNTKYQLHKVLIVLFYLCKVVIVSSYETFILSSWDVNQTVHLFRSF